MTDAQPVKRGRGRPRLPRLPLEAITDEQLADALREADQIAGDRSLQQMLAARGRSGLHPQAFGVARRLKKKGPAEAQEFYLALGRYLRMLGLVDSPGNGHEAP